MECAICLLEFQEDSAYVPDLGCHCTFIVHEECWERWNGTCLYCRGAETRIYFYIRQQETNVYRGFSYMNCCISSIMLYLLIFIISIIVVRGGPIEDTA